MALEEPKARSLETIRAIVTSDLDEAQRVEAYETFLAFQKLPDNEEAIQWLCRILEPLLAILRNDMTTKNEELAGLAMKTLGYLLHHKTIVAVCTDDSARAILVALVEIITTTSMKRLCSIGAWCIAQQQLRPELIAPHVTSIVAALVHAVDNPMDSLAVSVEAFQALVTLLKTHPAQMKKESAVWAPVACRHLLSEEKLKRESAEGLLAAADEILLPATSALSLSIANLVNRNLLPCMEKAVKNTEMGFVVVRAWPWLVKLLGRKLVEKNTDGNLLVNRLLKIPEKTFLSPQQPLRIATQRAWQALIDCLLFNGAAPGGKGAVAQPAPKRLALLMMPLINNMTYENDLHVRMACFRTWSYLLNRLESCITTTAVFQAVIQPMFDVILRKHPGKDGCLIWRQATRLLEGLLSARGQNQASEQLQENSQAAEGTNAKEEENGPSKVSVGSEDHFDHSTVQWGVWRLEQTDELLKLITLVLKAEWSDLRPSTLKNGTEFHSTSRVLRLWELLVKGIEAAGRADIRPAQEHVASVHSLMRFMHQICVRDAFAGSSMDTQQQKLRMQANWSLLKVLITELKPLILASSFYKLPIVEKGDAAFAAWANSRQEMAPASRFGEAAVDIISEEDVLGSSDPHSVGRGSPAFYLTAVWLQAALLRGSLSGSLEEIVNQLHELISVGMKGQEELTDIMVMLNVLEGLSSWWKKGVEAFPGASVTDMSSQQDTETDERNLSTAADTEPWSKLDLLLGVWRVIVSELYAQIAGSNDIKELGGNRPDFAYQVLEQLMLFPLRCVLLANQRDVSSAGLESTKEHWDQLLRTVYCVATLKNLQPNVLLARVFKGLLELMDIQGKPKAEGTSFQPAVDGLKGPPSDLLFSFTADSARVLEPQSSAAMAITRQRRKHTTVGGGSQSPARSSKTVGGKEVFDSSSISDFLTLLSRLLDVCRSRDCWHEAKRMLPAVSALASRLHSSNDFLLFAEAMFSPLEQWLRMGWDSPDVRNSQLPQDSQEVMHVDIAQELLQLLETCWQDMLTGLQKCHPRVQFDSELLTLMAPALSAAFVHPRTSLANVTIVFWEATFGKRHLVPLKYPSNLVPVLSSLKSKSSISLPFWIDIPEQNGHATSGSTAAPSGPGKSSEQTVPRLGPKSRPKALASRGSWAADFHVLNNVQSKKQTGRETAAHESASNVMAAARPWVGKTGARILEGFLHEQRVRMQGVGEASDSTTDRREDGTEKVGAEQQKDNGERPDEAAPLTSKTSLDKVVTAEGASDTQNPANTAFECGVATEHATLDASVSRKENADVHLEVLNGETSARTRGFPLGQLKNPIERRKASAAFLMKSLQKTIETPQSDLPVGEDVLVPGNTRSTMSSSPATVMKEDALKEIEPLPSHVETAPLELPAESVQTKKRLQTSTVPGSPDGFVVIAPSQKRLKVHLTRHQKEVLAAQHGQGPEAGGGGGGSMMYGTGRAFNGTVPEGSLPNRWWEDTQDTVENGGCRQDGPITVPHKTPSSRDVRTVASGQDEEAGTCTRTVVFVKRQKIHDNQATPIAASTSGSQPSVKSGNGSAAKTEKDRESKAIGLLGNGSDAVLKRCNTDSRPRKDEQSQEQKPSDDPFESFHKSPEVVAQQTEPGHAEEGRAASMVEAEDCCIVQAEQASDGEISANKRRKVSKEGSAELVRKVVTSNIDGALSLKQADSSFNFLACEAESTRGDSGNGGVQFSCGLAASEKGNLESSCINIRMTAHNLAATNRSDAQQPNEQAEQIHEPPFESGAGEKALPELEAGQTSEIMCEQVDSVTHLPQLPGLSPDALLGDVRQPSVGVAAGREGNETECPTPFPLTFQAAAADEIEAQQLCELQAKGLKSLQSNGKLDEVCSREDWSVARREAMASLLRRFQEVSREVVGTLEGHRQDDESLVDIAEEQAEHAAILTEVAALQRCLASHAASICSRMAKASSKKMDTILS